MRKQIPLSHWPFRDHAYSRGSRALPPYLASPYAIERWLAAIGLATMHDERALPILEPLLVEFVGPDRPCVPILPLGIFSRARVLAVAAAGGLGGFARGTVYTYGLDCHRSRRGVEVPEPQAPNPSSCGVGAAIPARRRGKTSVSRATIVWFMEEHRFVYALGRLGAFGALEGCPYVLVSTTIGEDCRPCIWTMRQAITQLGSIVLSCVPESHADEFRANIWRVLMPTGRARITVSRPSRDYL